MTTDIKTYGPLQAKTAKHMAENIWMWGIEMVQAVERGDLDRVTALTGAIANANAALAQLTARASK